jgi:Zn-dependent protease
MSMSWKLGRVAGIDVFLHPTFLLVLLFPQVNQSWPLGVVLVLSVFGCVFLHELGHALMARRFGIDTVDITLYPIGGVARLSRMPRSPGAEMLIALAGPAVNFAIVAALLGAGLLGLFGALPPALGAVAWNLIAINLVLGLFNLIPAFPMDGGRVLRALLTGWLGRVRATEIAAGVGQALAILFGVYCLIHGEWIQVFLAAFIFMAAASERARVVAEESHRRYDDGDGIWTAPAGYRWIQRGDGAWQLAPIVVAYPDGSRAPWR